MFLVYKAKAQLMITISLLGEPVQLIIIIATRGKIELRQKLPSGDDRKWFHGISSGTFVVKNYA